MKTTVIYHSADFDGIFCREIARKFLPNAELIGWNFGEPLVPLPAEGPFYIMDLPPDCVEGLVACGSLIFPEAQRLIWIDHHKTAIDRYPGDIPGYRIDGVAACRLAWQWFTNASNRPCTCEPPFHTDGHYDYCLKMRMPVKEEYIHRKVSEPRAVRLAGEYDIWDKRDPDAEVFQFGLRSEKLTSEIWRLLLSNDVDPVLCGTGMEQTNSALACTHLLNNGRLLQRFQQETDADIVNHRSFILEWEGLKFLALTTARCNSLTFAAKDIPETGHDALMGFFYNGKVWTISMYHAQHRKDLDLSTIAIKHGGGGHRGACGMTLDKLPFIP